MGRCRGDLLPFQFRRHISIGPEIRLNKFNCDVTQPYFRHKLSTKKNIIEMARELDVYFARLYPISKPEETTSSSAAAATQQYLAVSHSGVKLVERQRGLPTDTLEVGSEINLKGVCFHMKPDELPQTGHKLRLSHLSIIFHI